MKPAHKQPKRAAALSYDPARDAVPVLTAFGEGFLAEKIIATASEADVPIMVDEGLAQMLAALNVGDDIPPALYAAVAQILVFLSDSDQAYGKRIKQAAQGRHLN